MKFQSYRWIWLLATIALLLPLVLDGAQTPARGLRIVTPPDGTTVEPGQRFAVAVEGQPGVTPAAVSINSPGIFTVREHPPFTFSVSYPANAPLGPKRLVADGMDAQERSLGAQITINVETLTLVKSIQVTDPPLFIPIQQEISVSGVFADGVKREVTQSREIRYSSSNPGVATITADGVIEAIDNGTATIIVTYKNQSFSFPVKVNFKKVAVAIDIRPESPRNVVNLTSKGRLPVAIFSTRDFDATRVRLDTVRFGPNRARPVLGGDDDQDDDRDDREQEEQQRRQGKLGKIEDINGDGLPDLLLHFRIQDIGLNCADKQATLTGFTFRRELIGGSDAVLPSGPSCR